MNRRAFLKCLGAFTALAFIPAVSERICRAPAWAKKVVVYRSSRPLEPGSYTFSAYHPTMGIYIAGVTALGGETLFEVPYHDANHTQPRLKLGGITFGYTGFGEMSFTEQANRDKLLRGDEVFNA